jgi:predicted DNA-binding transcriptional regulator YafY
LPPLIFTEDEAAAILLGLVGTPWLRVSLPGAAIEAALSKISRVLPTTTRHHVETLAELLVVPDAGTFLDVGLLLRLSQASRDARCVALDYRTQETTSRIVEPDGVAGYDGRWYLVGFCRLRHDTRVFRLDRIQTAEVLDQGFQRPAGFDLGAFIQSGLEGQRWKVRLRFAATGDEVRKCLGPLGEITSALQGCRYEGPASDLDLLARQLLVTRLSFEVVDPPELREALARVAQEAHRRALGEPISS